MDQLTLQDKNIDQFDEYFFFRKHNYLFFPMFHTYLEKGLIFIGIFFHDIPTCCAICKKSFFDKLGHKDNLHLDGYFFFQHNLF